VRPTESRLKPELHKFLKNLGISVRFLVIGGIAASSMQNWLIYGYWDSNREVIRKMLITCPFSARFLSNRRNCSHFLDKTPISGNDQSSNQWFLLQLPLYY
jgi:hypothetical protein